MTRSPRPPGSGIVTLVLSLLAVPWLAESRDLAARAATGLLGRLLGGAFVPPLRAAFTLFLALLGLLLLDTLRDRSSTLARVLPLPRRPTAPREFGLGLSFGWAIVLAAILPIVLAGDLHGELWLQPRAWLTFLCNLVAAALVVLVVEAVFRGYLLPRLSRALGPAWATLLVSLLYAVLILPSHAGVLGFAAALTFSLLLAAAWQRTHALWLPWGVHFGFSASLGVFFGLPTFDGGDLSSILQAYTAGRPLLTGFGRGPVAAPWTTVCLLLALPLLFRATRDLAWSYTHPVLEPAGYPMDVPPPPAHTAAVAPPPPPPLVQILPAATPIAPAAPAAPPLPGRTPPSA